MNTIIVGIISLLVCVSTEVPYIEIPCAIIYWICALRSIFGEE